MTTFHDDGQVALLQGDVRAVLRSLPADAVNCVVTSPPYWSLRDYGVPQTVWGGEDGCEHDWTGQSRNGAAEAYTGAGRWQHGSNSEDGTAILRSEKPGDWKRITFGSDLCSKCGAWLGALGLEPTPELFIAHMVEVFREVRRVLRPDGTLWVNMGDSYAGSWSGSSMRPNGGTQRPGVPGALQVLDERWPDRGGVVPTGMKAKDLVGIPWMLAFALRTDGWWLRQDIIWSKPNPMPESTKDRCTKAHEYLFLLSKRERYWSDFAAIREAAGPERDQTAARRARADEAHKSAPTEKVNGIRSWKGSEFHDGKNAKVHPDVGKNGRSGQRTKENLNANWDAAEAAGAAGDTRNKRSVWHIPTAPFPEAHFATFPPALVEPCILAGCPEGGTVLDPFVGSGTTAMVSRQLGRKAIGIDLNPEYLAMAVRRVGALPLAFPVTDGLVVEERAV